METERLLTRLISAKSINEFLNRYQDFIPENDTFADHINKLRKAKKLRKSQVVSLSTIEKSYAYDLLSGKKENPSRNKVIMLAFGLHLDYKEAQTLLKHAGYAPLNPKSKRDSIIIYALTRQIDVISLNIMLDEHEQKLLN